MYLIQTSDILYSRDRGHSKLDGLQKEFKEADVKNDRAENPDEKYDDISRDYSETGIIPFFISPIVLVGLHSTVIIVF